MIEPIRMNKREAREAFKEINARAEELTAEAYKRSALGTFTEKFGSKLESEMLDISVRLAEVRKVFWPQLEEVAKLLEVNGEKRLLTASDYNEYMPNLKVAIALESPLPLDIVEILNSKCPVHKTDGVLVKDTHILAWVPDNLSLNMLSEALGGVKGRVLFSDWFTYGQEVDFGALTLNTVRKSGHWALIPDRFPPGTDDIGIIASTDALHENYAEFYIQPDVISFAAPLLLNAVKNEVRLYEDTYGWCRDPREGTHLDDESCFGGRRSLALNVGEFNDDGLWVTLDESQSVGLWGCAAVWNFGNQHLEF